MVKCQRAFENASEKEMFGRVMGRIRGKARHMEKEYDYEAAMRFHESAKQYGSVLGLDSIRELMRRLGDVWKALRVVHVAGTNGKGSVCCFLASVLKEAGYKTGQYASPAVFDLREAYQINGAWIEPEEYALCMQDVERACLDMAACGLSHPTVFEIETALAFLWFFRSKCEIVLLETGMGGSTDATNLLEQPLCSVITSIDMDHTQFLGETIAEIAAVKSGIIKEGCPVIVTEQPKEAEAVLRQKASEAHAAYYKALRPKESWVEEGTLCFAHPAYGTLHLSMMGSVQAQNAALAIKTVEVLRKQGCFVTDDQIRAGIESAVWAGRFACISKTPLFYIDGAHNVDAIRQLLADLVRFYPDMRRIGIFGVMADKPYRSMAAMAHSVFERIYTVRPDENRALPAETLAEEIRRAGGCACAADSVNSAVRRAHAFAEEADGPVLIVAFGSLYYLKEVKHAVYELTTNGSALIS